MAALCSAWYMCRIVLASLEVCRLQSSLVVMCGTLHKKHEHFIAWQQQTGQVAAANATPEPAPEPTKLKAGSFTVNIGHI